MWSRWMVWSLALAMFAVVYFCLPAPSQAASEHTLTVQQGSSLGIGGVRSGDGRLECTGLAPCQASFPEGAVVTLTATAGTGSGFEGFGGDCSGTTCTLTMNSNHNVEYFFFWTPRLVVHPEGTGAGYVESEPPGIDCGQNLPGHEQCAAEFRAGYVTLSSHPDTHSLFNGFKSPECSGLVTTCFTLLTTATEVDASFIGGAHSLTVTKAGDGGGLVKGAGPVYPELIEGLPPVGRHELPRGRTGRPQSLAPGVLNTFPTDIAVQPGDVIGLNDQNATAVPNACLTMTLEPGDAFGASSTGPDAANGATITMETVESGDRLNLSATLLEAPTITGLSAAGGPTAGGTAVTISGTEFADVQGVRFGSTAATYTVNSESQITATAPAGTAGTGPDHRDDARRLGHHDPTVHLRRGAGHARDPGLDPGTDLHRPETQR
jgi:IPT/TIG domain/Divergent InlB B-repeat domain